MCCLYTTKKKPFFILKFPSFLSAHILRSKEKLKKKEIYYHIVEVSVSIVFLVENYRTLPPPPTDCGAIDSFIFFTSRMSFMCDLFRLAYFSSTSLTHFSSSLKHLSSSLTDSSFSVSLRIRIVVFNSSSKRLFTTSKCSNLFEIYANTSSEIVDNGNVNI